MVNLLHIPTSTYVYTGDRLFIEYLLVNTPNTNFTYRNLILNYFRRKLNNPDFVFNSEEFEIITKEEIDE